MVLIRGTEESVFSFTLLDKKIGKPHQVQIIFDSDGKKVPLLYIIKGYNMYEGYVIMKEADFDKALPEKKQHINIA
jgi:non-homologous end joining protein Ku